EDAADLAPADPLHQGAKDGAARRLGRASLGQDLVYLQATTQRQELQLLDLGIDREDLPVVGFRGLAGVDDVRGHVARMFKVSNSSQQQIRQERGSANSAGSSVGWSSTPRHCMSISTSESSSMARPQASGRGTSTPRFSHRMAWNLRT